jgi:phosphate transport system substrate-binding protein
VKPIAIAAREGGPFVPLTPETVADRTYPLIRDAYVYLNRAPGRPMDPKVKEFLRFVLSREGQQIIADTDMYYPLTAAALREQLKKLD